MVTFKLPWLEFLSSTRTLGACKHAEPQNYTTWRRLFDAEIWPKVQGQPFLMSVAGGAASDRLAFAFVAGYQSALRALFPALCKEDAENGSLKIAAMCITEKMGNRPRDITTTLTKDELSGRYTLAGRKTFVSCAYEAENLFVAAADTNANTAETPSLKMVRVSTNQAGMDILHRGLSVRPELPIIPEISHGIVDFTNALVGAECVLPGDGYSLYIKPFRTIEDIYVNSAILGYLTMTALQNEWPQSLVEALVADVATMQALSTCDPSAPETHIALAGALQRIRGNVDDVGRWMETASPPYAAANWKRDVGLLSVAHKVQNARREAAWRKLFDRTTM